MDDKSDIAIAVTPDEDCIAADAIQPTKKLLSLVLTDLDIKLCNFVINNLFRLSLIWSKENKKSDNPLSINNNDLSMVIYMINIYKYDYVIILK